MTTLELIEYYTNLLIIQYATKPAARAMISAFVEIVIQNQIYGQVGDAFKFTVDPVGQPADGAAGVQLNAVASYRGVNRVIYGLAPNSYFEMVDAEDIFDGNGFMDADESPLLTTWLFLTSSDTQQPLYSLTDDQMYRLTQLRAQVQRADLSIKTIDDILETFFGDNAALIDNENMTLYYVDLNSDMDTLFGIAAITNSLPHPAGVLVQTFRADLLTDFFGLQDAETDYDSSFSGFSDALTTLTTGTFISAP